MQDQHGQQAPTSATAGRDDIYGTGSLILGVLAIVGAFVITGGIALLALPGGALATIGHRKLAEGTATNKGVVMFAGILNSVIVAVGAIYLLIQFVSG